MRDWCVQAAGLNFPQSCVQGLGCGVVCGDHVHVFMQSSSQVAPEETIKTVQMVLAPSQGRPLPPVHLESVSLGLLLPPPQVCRIRCTIEIRPH